MAMLAERKRKQRWSLNPRGKAWLEDKNGFGQKMLEKMGWKYGKGLGANEQGLTESLKVSYKNDSKGMGYKDTEGWTAHDQNFSSFLENLNGSSEQSQGEIKVDSLEKKVQNCKARINYHKFTRAKDLSRYSEKDLANIFGKKSLRENKNKLEKEETHEETAEDTQGTNEDMLVNKGSMIDYFRRKLPNFGRAIDNVRETESESEGERVGFGFRQDIGDSTGAPEERKSNKRKYFESFFPHFEKSSEDCETADGHEEKKRCKKSLTGNFISYMYEDAEENKINDGERQAENCNEDVGDLAKSKKSKKLKINKEENRRSEETIYEGANKGQNKICHDEALRIQINSKKKSKKLNDAEEIGECSIAYEEESSTDIKDNKKQKKSKRKSKEVCEELEENFSNSHDEIEEYQAVTKCSRKGKKSKSKRKNEEILRAADGIDSLNNGDNTSQDIKIEDASKKDKKIKSKRKNEEIQEAADCIYSKTLSNDGNASLDIQIEDASKKDKKTKSKRRYEEIEEVTARLGTKISSNESIPQIRIQDESENGIKQKKSKKSKKHQENGIENVAFYDYTDENEVIREEKVGETDSNPSDKKQKKSKKKKFDEGDNLGISNLAFDDVCNPSCVLQADLEETPRKKKKKKNRDGIDNPTFNVTADDADTPGNRFELTNKGGLDNPALNLNDPILDCDLMLNVVHVPVISKKPVEKFALNAKIKKVNSVKARRKSVRFSDVLQEHIIPNDPSERINEYISNRNELFDINTMVIEESLKEQMQKQGIVYKNGNGSMDELYNSNDPKEFNKKVVESSVKEELSRGLNAEGCGFINSGFDIRSVDKVNFFDDKYEVKSSPTEGGGIDNRGFNALKNRIEENVGSIAEEIERYQAVVENDMNESKANRAAVNDWLVGDIGSQIDQNVKVEEGLKLCFKEMHFKTPVPSYLKTSVNRAKKSYRHLIRGDITIAFKNSNLDEIKGYAVKNK